MNDLTGEGDEEIIDGDEDTLASEESPGWPLGTYILALGGGLLIFAGIVGCVLGAQGLKG